MTGLLGWPVGWEAVVTRLVPNAYMAWMTTSASTVQYAGVVRFDSTPEGGTLVDIKLSYNPPCGAIGHAVAMLFGCDPKCAMDHDLVDLKSLLEQGKTTAQHEVVTREDRGIEPTGSGCPHPPRSVSVERVSVERRAIQYGQSETRAMENATMMKKFLVPLDGSCLAERALPYATRLAQRTEDASACSTSDCRTLPSTCHDLLTVAQRLRADGVDVEAETLWMMAGTVGSVIADAARRQQR